MGSKKVMVVFPGMGYHKDKPYLYYAWKLATEKGYEILHVDYFEFFKGIKYSDAEMHDGAIKAYEKTKVILGEVDFSQYETVVFAGKSFGTVMGAKYAAEHGLKVKQLWYTPVGETFEYNSCDAVAFTGSKDPIANTDALLAKAAELGIELHVYEGANHSLETGDVARDLETLQDVMRITKEYL